MRTIAIIFLFCVPSFASAQVLINEIAWMGTSDSTSNEWVELANDGSSSADITGWILSIEGKKDIALSGSINTGKFYIIERTDDTTVPTVTADLIASFGTGISNTGATLSLKNASGDVVDRVDGSQEWNIGGIVAGNNSTKETAQRGASGWFTGMPTPRLTNIGTASTPEQGSNTNTLQVNATPITASFPVEPQIFADAGASVRTAPSGAPIVFTGRAFGLKKEPIENARMIWSFGDGGRAEGASVAHTYYYPGDYVVVLDVASGYYSASDRATVRVSAPLVALSVGGDQTHSFVTLENSGVDEIDLSDWQISSSGKIFIFPKNTILSSRKTLTLASEVTGLVTPVGSVAELSFPNGSRVSVKSAEKKELIVSETLSRKVEEESKIKPTAQIRPTQTAPLDQKASIADAFSDIQTSLPTQKGDSAWYWYIGVAFLSTFALLSIRLTKGNEDKTSITADDFEIIEEVEDNEPH